MSNRQSLRFHVNLSVFSCIVVWVHYIDQCSYGNCRSIVSLNLIKHWFYISSCCVEQPVLLFIFCFFWFVLPFFFLWPNSVKWQHVFSHISEARQAGFVWMLRAKYEPAYSPAAQVVLLVKLNKLIIKLLAQEKWQRCGRAASNNSDGDVGQRSCALDHPNQTIPAGLVWTVSHLP